VYSLFFYYYTINFISIHFYCDWKNWQFVLNYYVIEIVSFVSITQIWWIFFIYILLTLYYKFIIIIGFFFSGLFIRQIILKVNNCIYYFFLNSIMYYDIILLFICILDSKPFQGMYIYFTMIIVFLVSIFSS